MTSYKVSISDKRRYSSRFITKTNIFMIKTIKDKLFSDGKTQRFLSEKTGIDEGTISRIMKGEGNLTLRTIGELAWAVGLSFELQISKERTITDHKKINHAKNTIYELANQLDKRDKLYILTNNFDLFKIERNEILSYSNIKHNKSDRLPEVTDENKIKNLPLIEGENFMNLIKNKKDTKREILVNV